MGVHRSLVVTLGIAAVGITVVVAAIRVPAVRPLIVFVVIAGAFAIAGTVFGIAVFFSHMDTGMTDDERTTLNLEVGALLVAGVVLGALSARWVHRLSR